MASGTAEEIPEGVFRVNPEHTPQSKQEAYRRLHYYVAKMGVTVSDCLQDALIRQRKAAFEMTDRQLLKTALKGFSDDEFLPAVKEITVVWLHLESLDQGGHDMPGWLLTFLRLAFGATDYLYPEPKSVEILKAYEYCESIHTLYQEASYRAAWSLGFREPASYFASIIIPLFIDTGPLRQQVLQKALTLPASALLTHSLFE